MATYYTRIKGKNYDKKLISTAEKSVKGRGDGRISLQDAKKLLGSVKDASGYSDIEKKTMKYIRDNYDFTPEADRWFRTEIRKWVSTKNAGVKTAPKKKKALKRIKKTVKQRPSFSEPREGIYEKDEMPETQRVPDGKAKTGGKNLFLRILLFVIILIIFAFIVLLLSPTCRDEAKTKISPLLTCIKNKTKITEEKKPVIEPDKDALKKQEETPEQKETDGQFYTVQVKDDLVSISEKLFHNYSQWKDIYEANRDIIKNPTMIFPGQKLKIPDMKKN
jgi:hypothetical protein